MQNCKKSFVVQVLPGIVYRPSQDLAVNLNSLPNFGDDSANVRKVFSVCIRASSCDDQVDVIWVACDDRLLVTSDAVPRNIRQSTRVSEDTITHQ